MKFGDSLLGSFRLTCTAQPSTCAKNKQLRSSRPTSALPGELTLGNGESEVTVAAVGTSAIKFVYSFFVVVIVKHKLAQSGVAVGLNSWCLHERL